MPEHTPPPSTAALDARWRFARLLTAPHRLGFFVAAVWLVTSALWWLTMLALRALDVAVPWAVPPPLAHALVMSLGTMPLFIIGFLYTAGPRWLALPEVPAHRLLGPVLALAGGWAIALPGLHLNSTWAAAGLALAAAGWIAVLLRFVTLLRASRVPDKVHPRAVAAAMTVGAVAYLAAAWSVARGDAELGRAAAQLALWGFLAPTFATVSHRMIPFFTASALPALDAWRPLWLLAVMWTVLMATALAAVVQTVGELPSFWRAALALLQAAAAVLLLWLAVRWGLVQSLRIRLLAMLHAGFVWLGLALALSAASHVLVLTSGAQASLGLAPLHALTLGYLGSTLFAMATRVASGHSGRPLAADDLAWTLYLAAQAAALLRVVAALWPAAQAPLGLAAGTAWALACVGWALRYGGWMGRPRVDGRPG